MLTRRVLLAAGAAAGTASCAASASRATTVAGAAPPAPMVGASVVGAPMVGAPVIEARAGDFGVFIAGVRAEGMRSGISPATLDRALGQLQPDQKVLELDRRQPEFTLTWQRYRSTRLSDNRIAQGRQIAAQNAALLRAVEARYGVSPGILMGIWGLESNYGGYTGGFNVVDALATLAYDGRRASFFRPELIAALRILDHGDVSFPRMLGSYAGAMGQPQFMPSSYLRYAVDFSGTGRRDIWDDRGDVLGSIANYMARSGWRAGEGWGQNVRLPGGFDAGLAGRDNRMPIAEWARMGVRQADGAPLRGAGPAAVVLPDGAGGDAYLVYPNFSVIRRYNPSDYYALVVGMLGDLVVA